MIRVLIVDDQDIVRQGLGVILKHQQGIEVVGFATDGQSALEQVASTKPDVVLMDLRMPGMNGLQATRRITQQFPNIKVVVLTTYSTDEWVFDAVRAGACSYLLKDNNSKEIVRAIRGAVEGEVRIDPLVAGRILQEFNRLAESPVVHASAITPPPASTEPSPLLEPLTEREISILQHLVKGMGNREIGETLSLAEGTVKNYVSSIIAKLQANDRTQAAIIALKHGLAKLE